MPRSADVRRPILRWAATLDRPLPWRAERDPWRILCSEMMLQQTQAARVAAVFEGFMTRFPTAKVMASSDAADVLVAWGDLGYPRRALNLWRSAQAIAERGWPQDVETLCTLPGVGPYTARAVASFAFDADVAAVDANVRRVVSRVFGAADVQTVADSLVPKGKGAVWNQAMIDLGAVVCTARAPRCPACPLRRMCAWQPQAQAVRRPATRFADTMRYARGRVVASLRDCGPLTEAALVRRTSLERERLRSAIEGLQRDELVHRRGRSIALGPAASSRR